MAVSWTAVWPGGADQVYRRFAGSRPRYLLAISAATTSNAKTAWPLFCCRARAAGGKSGIHLELRE